MLFPPAVLMGLLPCNSADAAKELQLLRCPDSFQKLMCMCGMQRCTKSYARLPEAYPRLRCSGRGDLERSVLNDDWVSVTTGSEDYSFKVGNEGKPITSVE